jgi:hypothetical protein
MDSIPKSKEEERKQLDEQIKKYEEENGPIKTTPIKPITGAECSPRLKRFLGAKE